MPLVDQYGRPVTAASRTWTRPQPPATAVGTWTYQDATNAVKASAFAEITPEEYEANRLVAELHDHWQDGKGWIGPNGGGDGEVWRIIKGDIERQFTPVDVIGESLTRFANALLKLEPSVEYAPLEPGGQDGQPSEEQAAEAAEARRASAAWWDRVKLWRQARRVTKRARWATRGLFRVYVDEAQYVDVNGVRQLPTGFSLDEAFARVQLTAPEPRDGAVVLDQTTAQPVAVLLYPRTEGAGATARTVNVAQTWSYGAGADAGRIVVRDIPERGAAKTFTVPITRLPLAELSAELMVTDPTRRQQKRLNFSESSIVRSAETSAFAERYFLNAEPSGIWMTGEPPEGENVGKIEYAPDGVTPVRYLVRVPPTLGALVVNELIGIETGPANQDGVAPRADPQVYVKEPTDPEHILKTSRHARGTMLQSVAQGHVLRPTDQQVSGYSQEQARSDFVDDASNTKAELEAMLRDILEAALAWALAMVGEGSVVRPDFLQRFRCVVMLKISAGPLSEGEQRAIVEQFEKGLISRETAMARLGVEDVDAELALLGGTETAQLARLKAYAETMAAIAMIPGGGLEAAVRAMTAIGLDEEVLQALLPSDADPARDDPENQGGGA